VTGQRSVLLVVEQLRRRVPGGIGTYVRGLLQGLEGLEGLKEASTTTPSFLTLYASRGREGRDPVRELGWSLRESFLPGRLMVQGWDHRLLDVPKGFDVVHATSFAAPPARGMPLSMMVHDLAFREAPETFPPRGRRWHERALGRALRHASALVVTSQKVASDLVGAGASGDRIRIIPHGCDHLPPPDFSAADELLGRLGVRGEFILSVSTLEPRKNLPRLLEAYRIARDRLPERWQFVVVGPVGWGPEIRAPAGAVLTQALGGATLAALYRRARLLCYVPLAEGFGLPPLEAMRLGTPVVSSPVPSVADSAMLVDPFEVEEIAEAMVKVGTDDELRGSLAEAGRARALPLTWSAAARRHLDLWDSMV